MDDATRFRFLEAGRVRLHVAEAGPQDGPPVVLLHGFPEFWYAWRRQIGPLAEAGFRLLVPDQRGYNLSDKPRRVANYRLDLLVDDVIGLLDVLGWENAAIVGHDWGAAVAWWMAARNPERVRRLVVLNVPHPVVMRRQLWNDADQRRRSRYMFFFQLPWLPEWAMRRHNWTKAVRSVRGTARRGTFDDEDMARYRQAWSRPGAARGMIHWYRAALRRPPRCLADPRIRVPTLVIWGARDRFLSRAMIDPSLELCLDGRAEILEDATHWVQHEEPQRVNALLRDFLAT